MLRELSDPTGFAWIDSESGGVVLWNRYTHNLYFATSNEPGIRPVRMLAEPYVSGAGTPKLAREMAEVFFAGSRTHQEAL